MKKLVMEYITIKKEIYENKRSSKAITNRQASLKR